MLINLLSMISLFHKFKYVVFFFPCFLEEFLISILNFILF